MARHSFFVKKWSSEHLPDQGRWVAATNSWHSPSFLNQILHWWQCTVKKRIYSIITRIGRAQNYYFKEKHKGNIIMILICNYIKNYILNTIKNHLQERWDNREELKNKE